MINSNGSCIECQEAIPIGEGDIICLECTDQPLLVIENYQPTENYGECMKK